MSEVAPTFQPPSVLRHYLRYLNSNVLIAVAGFVSFPIMTRYLDEQEYGKFGYWQSYLLIWVAVLKLGMQHSISRLYASDCLNRDGAERRRFYTTLVAAPGAISTGLFLLTLGGLWTWHLLSPIPDVRYILIVLVIGQVGVITSLIYSVMRAREFSAVASWFQVGLRYTELVLVVGTLTAIAATAWGVYMARTAAAVLSLLWIAAWALRHCEFGREGFSARLFRAALAYGLPLVACEIAFILLAFADHVMIKHLIATDVSDYTDVGIYTVGYGLAMHVGVFMQHSIEPAFGPVANRIYETDGPEAVLRLQRRLLGVLLHAVAAIMVGLIVVGGDFFIIIAGTAKAESAPVFVWIAVNYLWMPVFTIWSHGLRLRKRTRTITLVVVAATAANIALNLLWIPRFGYMGSVYATLLCYNLMGVAQVLMTPHNLRPMPRTGQILLPAALAAVMYGVARATDLWGLESHPGRLAAMAGLFVVCYVLPALTLDGPLRRDLIGKLRR